MKTCPKCQYPNPERLDKCFKCGERLATPASAPGPPSPQADVPDPTVRYELDPEVRAMAWVHIVLGSLVAFGVLLFVAGSMAMAMGMSLAKGETGMVGLCSLYAPMALALPALFCLPLIAWVFLLRGRKGAWKGLVMWISLLLLQFTVGLILALDGGSGTPHALMPLSGSDGRPTTAVWALLLLAFLVLFLLWTEYVLIKHRPSTWELHMGEWDVTPDRNAPEQRRKRRWLRIAITCGIALTVAWTGSEAYLGHQMVVREAQREAANRARFAQGEWPGVEQGSAALRICGDPDRKWHTGVNSECWYYPSGPTYTVLDNGDIRRCELSVLSEGIGPTKRKVAPAGRLYGVAIGDRKDAVFTALQSRGFQVSSTSAARNPFRPDSPKTELMEASRRFAPNGAHVTVRLTVRCLSDGLVEQISAYNANYQHHVSPR